MQRTLLLALVFSLLTLSPAFSWREKATLQALIPDLEIHTSFAHDYGESLEKVTYKGQEFEPHEATSKILPLLNWRERADKLELGTAWARFFGLYGCDVLSEGHYLHREEFDEPVAELLPDGTFRFTAWVADMRGREPGRISYTWVEISPDAVMTVGPRDRDRDNPARTAPAASPVSTP